MNAENEAMTAEELEVSYEEYDAYLEAQEKSEV